MERKLFDIKVDPDYEPPKKEESKKGLTKSQLILSLILPVLSCVAVPVLWVMELAFPLFSAILGIAFGGIVPIVMIVRKKIDISKYLAVKLALLGLLIVFVVLQCVFFRHWERRLLIFPVVILAAECVFAFTRKTDIDTKIALGLSSLGWAYLGMVFDFYVMFGRLF